MSSNVFQPTVKKREFPYRGPLSSRDLNSFQDEVVADLSRLALVVNSLSAAYHLKVLELEEERRKNAALLLQRREELEDEALRRAEAEETLTYVQSFRDLKGLLFTGINEARRLRIEPGFGTAMVPLTRMVSRLGSKDPETDQVFFPDTLSVSVAAVDEGEGDVKAGEPRLCVDSFGAEPWVRKVIFPLADTQNEVIMDVTINVPSLFAEDANLLTIVPSPAGEVDIVSVQYSVDDQEPSLDLPGFSEIEGAGATLCHFAPLAITKVKIRLRQRHFTIEENEKVFLYGLKEVGLFLAELDKTSAATPIQSNNTAIFAVNAPSGYTFDSILGFRSSPDFAVSGSDNKIYFQIYAEEGLSTKLWDSFDDATPTISSPLDISAQNLETLYVVVYLEYDSAEEASPVLRRFAFDYTVA